MSRNPSKATPGQQLVLAKGEKGWIVIDRDREIMQNRPLLGSSGFSTIEEALSFMKDVLDPRSIPERPASNG